MKTLARQGIAHALLFLTVMPVWAQETAAQPGRSRDLLSGIISTLIFGMIGIVLAILGFKLFDLVVHHHIEKEIFENKNVAAALLAGSIVVGVCFIIGATILAP